MMTFDELGLSKPILQTLATRGYETPTQIQVDAIPLVLQGKDILGCAQTGTGKTAAFALPIIERLYRAKQENGFQGTRCLVLTPTRELTNQVYECFTEYAKLTNLNATSIFGGIPRVVQYDALSHECDIIVATPGRLLDLVASGHIDLSQIDYFVLDEADSMLRLGFIEEVKKVIELIPEQCCSLLFSATFPWEVMQIANNLLDHPTQVKVEASTITADGVEQALYFVAKEDRNDLIEYVLLDPSTTSVVIFTNTRQEAESLNEHMALAKIPAEVIHSEKTQAVRTEILERFRLGELRVLIGTDLISRGIDIKGVTHIFNCGLPPAPETYVHRVGRTGRAGESGVAYSFVTPEEIGQLNEIEQMIRQVIPVIDGHPLMTVALRKQLMKMAEELADKKVSKAKVEKPKIGYYERQKRALAQKRQMKKK